MQRIFSVNTLVPVFLTQRLLKKNLKGKHRLYSHFRSAVYLQAFENTMYRASKGALQFYENVFLKISVYKIQCNNIKPSMINTGLLKTGTYSEEDSQKNMQKNPMKQYGEPREMVLSIDY